MQAIIEQVLADKASYGEAVQPPAAQLAIDTVSARVQQAFGATLPPDFAQFLALTNGLTHNGAVLYGADQTEIQRGPGGFWQGVVEANTMWREGPGHMDYLVLGDTDMDLFTVDLNGENPVLREKVSSDVFVTYASVAEAIEAILRERM